MAKYYNPLSVLFREQHQGFEIPGYPKNPLAHIIRSTLREKIYDAFWVFNGASFFKDRFQYGILDYMGFVVLDLILKGIQSLFDSDNCIVINTKIIWFLPMSILKLACIIVNDIVRQVLAILLTFALALPIIAIIHPITSLVKNSIEKSIHELAKNELIIECKSKRLFSIDSVFKCGSLEFIIETNKNRENQSYSLIMSEQSGASFFKKYNSIEELRDSSLAQKIMWLA